MVYVIVTWAANSETLNPESLQFVEGENTWEILTFPSIETAEGFVEGLKQRDEEEGEHQVDYKVVEIPYVKKEDYYDPEEP